METAIRTITVRVLLFGSYAERLSLESLELALEPPATVGDVVHRLRTLSQGDQLPSKPLCAVNLAHASAKTALADGDEVAVLPPLAGG